MTIPADQMVINTNSKSGADAWVGVTAGTGGISTKLLIKDLRYWMTGTRIDFMYAVVNLLQIKSPITAAVGAMIRDSLRTQIIRQIAPVSSFISHYFPN